jgi:ABC-type Fe3+ transport system permease subunit
MAAARGARQTLKEICLDNGEAAKDIRELRSLLSVLRLARRTAWQTAVRILTTVFLAALLAWAGARLKLFGGL